MRALEGSTRDVEGSSMLSSALEGAIRDLQGSSRALEGSRKGSRKGL